MYWCLVEVNLIQPNVLQLGRLANIQTAQGYITFVDAIYHCVSINYYCTSFVIIKILCFTAGFHSLRQLCFARYFKDCIHDIWTLLCLNYFHLTTFFVIVCILSIQHKPFDLYTTTKFYIYHSQVCFLNYLKLGNRFVVHFEQAGSAKESIQIYIWYAAVQKFKTKSQVSAGSKKDIVATYWS